MTIGRFQCTTTPSDPIMRFKIPIDIRNATLKYALQNERTMEEEIIARLARTLEHEEMMRQDRLYRLIFCKKLAFEHKGKTW